ncbi:MAG: Rhomboid protease GlpG [Chlamydiia bacterium]|nr:Rhomboid protease GlpG [Chlamydiia bacterium]
MRKLGTVSQQHILPLVRFFRSQQIEVVTEIAEANAQQSIVWCCESEELLEKAKQLFDEFVQNPEDPKFRVEEPPEPIREPAAEESEGFLDEPTEEEEAEGNPSAAELVRPRRLVQSSTLLTKFFLLLCLVVYGITLTQRTRLDRESSPSFFFPKMTPIEMAWIYDLPMALVYSNQLAEEYEYETKEELEQLGPGAHELMMKITHTPFWEGIYPALVNWGEAEQLLKAPKFVSIREGQVWRTITPAFLHADILHLAFNMLWLWMLGRLVEDRVGFVRYLAMTLIFALATNFFQYLMSGPFFLGYSGVITGLAGYAWMRQRDKVSEGFPIPNNVFFFLWIFVFGLFAIQVVAFILQIVHIISFDMPIANTAHITGALLGMGCAKIPLFQRKII